MNLTHKNNSETNNPIVFSADLLIADSNRSFENGAVIVNNGIVTFCGRRKDAINELVTNSISYTEINYPAVMTPGLINAHTHLQYTGMSELGRKQFDGMQHWAKAFDKVYNPLSHGEGSLWKKWAIDGAKMLLESGTTAAAELLTDKEAASVLHDEGIHGIVYREIIRVENDDWTEGSEERILNSLSKIPPEPGVGIGPHAPYSMGSIPLREINRIAHNINCRTHIHVGELKAEAELPLPIEINELDININKSEFREMRLAQDGRSSVKYLAELGVLDEKCHIAHGIYLNNDDREILRKRNVSVALCPRSNAVIGLDEAPIASYLNEGNLLCLGTDSLSSSPSLDILDDAALFCKIAKKQKYSNKNLYTRLFDIITKGGAIALGKAEGVGKLGVIDIGSSADFAFFDVDKKEPLVELLESGGGHCVATIISGEKKYEKP